MVQYRAKDVVKWLNIFTSKGGVYKTYSPITKLTVKILDYKKDFNISFGSYRQAIYQTNPRNMTMTRTLGVIYLQALDMLQGGFEVMNLLTLKVTYHCKVILIQITQKLSMELRIFPKKRVLNPC